MHFNAYLSSPSSSSGEDECVSMEESPRKLLAIAIQKRRALFGRKERDYRLELLQTGFIQSLILVMVNHPASRCASTMTKIPSVWMTSLYVSVDAQLLLEIMKVFPYA
ncbi:unnamed protein product [Nippostrongylus brasiliensis]|uniref:Homeobox domain-containing protein n=1 Tax=Nippostrongylus brasiliensis TaxID=27835 RepID=A0A0N4YUP4_NIPBR|nr:unnamed protein product [Nippostrongylus brasiliensis]